MNPTDNSGKFRGRPANLSRTASTEKGSRKLHIHLRWLNEKQQLNFVFCFFFDRREVPSSRDDKFNVRKSENNDNEIRLISLGQCRPLPIRVRQRQHQR